MSDDQSFYRTRRTGGQVTFRHVRVSCIEWFTVGHRPPQGFEFGSDVGYRSVYRLKLTFHSRDNRTQAKYIDILIMIGVLYLLHYNHRLRVDWTIREYYRAARSHWPPLLSYSVPPRRSLYCFSLTPTPPI